MKKIEIYPAITLYQPWASWIMRGWKTIETRTHSRFKCLKGKTIIIHAGQKTDKSTIKNPYLTHEQLVLNPDEIVNGCILGFAFVYDFGKVDDGHSKEALIECRTDRWGLFLRNIEPVDPIYAKGEMGIWYYDIKRRQKANKPTEQIGLFQF